MRHSRVSTGIVAALLFATAAGVVAAAVTFGFTGPAKYGVYLADVQTGKIRYIAGFYDWSLSPDGKWIAGGHEAGLSHDISVVSVATGAKTFLKTYRQNGPAHPEFAWSADSRWLRVSCDWDWEDSDDSPRVDILAVWPKARSGPKPAASSVNAQAPLGRAPGVQIRGYRVVDAVYSPDRRRVAAVCVHGRYGQPGYDGGIFLCSPNGSNRTRVTRHIWKGGGGFDYRTDADDREVRWLPNGKGILFRRTGHEDEGI